MSDEPHWLVILEPGIDYEIEHLPDCPTEAQWIDPGGHPIEDFTCIVGNLISSTGLDDNGVEWRELPAGRYPLTGWATYQPSTPMGPEEWDAGLEIKLPDE